MIHRFASVALIVLIASSRLEAQVIHHVPSAATPTFASAVAAAGNNDLILLSAGSHSTAGTTFPITKVLRIEGAGMNATVLHGSPSVAQTAVLSIKLTSNFSVLKNLTILPTANGSLPGPNSVRQGLRLSTNSGTFSPTYTYLLDHVRFVGCSGLTGGAIQAEVNTRIDALGCEFDSNSATGTSKGGGAVRISEGVFRDCLFTNNQSSNHGGAIYVHPLGLEIWTSRFDGNAAAAGGGAIAGRTSQDVGLRRTYFLNNSAVDGAAWHFRPVPHPFNGTPQGARVLAEQCYLKGNAGTGGARLLDIDSETFTMAACTIRDNQGTPLAPLGLVTTAKPIGGGLISFTDTLIDDAVDATLYLTAVPGSSGLPPAPQVSSVSLSCCILRDPPVISAITTVSFRAMYLDPALVATGPDSYVLLPGSPAVDGGCIGMTDLDLAGNLRPVGSARDIGCFELQNRNPGPAFAGTVAAGDLLSFNGTSGGVTRSVSIDAGTICTLAVSEPVPGTAAPFILWGYLGVPGPAEAFPIPFAGGSMAFTPHLIQIGNPLLFTMADNILSSPLAALASTPSPWSVTGPSLPFPITMTLQGLIADGTGPLRITNAMTLHTR